MAPHPIVEPLTGNARARLTALTGLLRSMYADLRYVDYAQAERDCEQLAVELTRIYPGHELDQFSFTAIPRGGSIVLGMLSYLLDLSPRQLRVDPTSTGPVVVVDDCALSGRRFADFLAGNNSAHVVFAHLYSAAALRAAIVQQEERVQHCVAAHDLTDRAESMSSSEYKDWVECWQSRLGDGRYWIGQPQLVCFAWGEPDHVFWNPVTQRVEQGWQFVPPHRCMKNRTALETPPAEAAERVWQVPDGVVSGRFDDVLWLVHVDSEQIYSLNETAADMWQAVATYGCPQAVTGSLSERYDVARDRLARDVSDFVKHLAQQGLVERVEGGRGES